MDNLIYPRSPRETMDGWHYLPRYIDKIRLHLAGKLHSDYQDNLGKAFDALWLKAAGLTSAELDWINRHSSLSLSELQRSFENEPGFRSLSAAAQQESLDRLAQLYNSRHGQGLDLTFAKPDSQIVSADIVVRGYPPTAHVIPATPSAPSEVSETFHLTAASGKPLLHSSIWTAHMTMVNSVELTRLVYADGTAWQPSAPRQCETSPSLFVLVNSAAR